MARPIKIQTNEEGMKAIHALGDAALKAGGNNMLNLAIAIYGAIKPIPPQVKAPSEDSAPADDGEEAKSCSDA